MQCDFTNFESPPQEFIGRTLMVVTVLSGPLRCIKPLSSSPSWLSWSTRDTMESKLFLKLHLNQAKGQLISKWSTRDTVGLQNLWSRIYLQQTDLQHTSVSRTVACLGDPEMGTPTIRGWGGVNILDIGGRAPKPLEKAGQMGLGNEQTKIDLKQKRTC